MENPKEHRSPLTLGVKWLLLIGLILAFLMYFRGFLIPFAIAVILWYLIHEIVNLTGKIKIAGFVFPQWSRTVFALMVMLGVIFGFGELIALNANQIAEKMGDYNQSIDEILNELGSISGLEDLSLDLQEKLDSLKIGDVITNALSSFTNFLGSTIMVIIYSVFLLIEERALPYKLKKIFGEEGRNEETQALIERINRSVRQYISVKTAASLLTAALSYGVLILFGVDFPILWAFLIFLFNYIPYIGSMVAVTLPTILSIFQLQSIFTPLWMFLCLEAIQFLVGSYLEPRVQGRSLNLSPLVVLLTLSFWGSVWGVVGMAISVPITSMMVIIMAEFPQTRTVAIALSEKGNINPIEHEVV